MIEWQPWQVVVQLAVIVPTVALLLYLKWCSWKDR